MDVYEQGMKHQEINTRMAMVGTVTYTYNLLKKFLKTEIDDKYKYCTKRGMATGIGKMQKRINNYNKESKAMHSKLAAYKKERNNFKKMLDIFYLMNKSDYKKVELIVKRK